MSCQSESRKKKCNKKITKTSVKLHNYGGNDIPVMVQYD